MPTQEVVLYPHSGTYDGTYPSDSFHPYPAQGGMVGGGECLTTDDDDASYIEGWNTAGANRDAFVFTLDPLVIPAGWTCTAIRFEWRLRNGGLSPNLELDNFDASMMSYYGITFASVQSPASGTFDSGAAGGIGTTYADVTSWDNPNVPALVAGAKVTLTVHEDTSAGAVSDYVRVTRLRAVCTLTSNVNLAPPCHLYPRDDSQGVGSGAIWPPPSSGRPGSYY